MNLIIISLVIFGVTHAAVEKRAHNHEPSWIEHCWDESSNTHLLDPFCALLVDNICEDPPTIANGYYKTPFDKHVNSKVTYVCNDGFTMSGPDTIQCQRLSDGAFQWTPTPKCIITACPPAPRVDNASFKEPVDTNVGRVIDYICDEGYAISNVNTVECLTGGEWSRPLPNCIPICKPVPEIANGYSDGETSRLIGTKVEYTCIEGYKLVDVKVIHCVYEPQTNKAAWSKLPECTEITCPTPVAGVRSQFLVNDTSALNETIYYINDTLRYRCDAGFYFTNNAPSVVNGGGSQIVYPDVPANDEYEYEDEDNMTTTTDYPTTTTDYFTTTTAPNYDNDTDTGNETTGGIEFQTTTTTEVPTTLAPTTTTTEVPTTTTQPAPVTPGPYETITCELVGNQGVWTKTKDCVIDCWPIPNVDNAGRTNPPNTFFGANVTYTCKAGYELVGQALVTCTETGRWTELPYCQPVCPEPPVVENSYISNNETFTTTKDSQLYYVCQDGYYMKGPEVVTCVDTPGEELPVNWSEAPKCIAACEIPAYISNGTRTEPDNLNVGATVTYSCDDNFHLKGPAVSTCLRWGNWTEVPECVHYCQVIPNIPNSRYVTYSTSETEVVRFICKEQYELIGNDTLTCENGTWSKPYPVCKCIIKPIDVIFIIDGSGSMGQRGFQETKDFVRDMVNKYPFNTTQFGLLVFSSDATPIFRLNEYNTNKTELLEVIQNTPFPSGGTKTFDALEVARLDMFTEKNGMRPNVSQIAIVVTDGRSGQFNKTSEQADLLRAEGVTIYSVGVGATDQNELEAIASDTSYVFHVENYDAISSIEGPLAGVTCEAMGDEIQYDETDDDDGFWV